MHDVSCYNRTLEGYEIKLLHILQFKNVNDNGLIWKMYSIFFSVDTYRWQKHSTSKLNTVLLLWITLLNVSVNIHTFLVMLYTCIAD